MMKNAFPVRVYTHRLLAVVLWGFTFFSPGNAQGEWKFQIEKNGIKVYLRQQEESDFDALRATFEAEATLSQYAATVLNVEDYKYWNYAATNPYVVRRINESELIYYTEAKAPWPVVDRYVVVRLKVTQDPQSKVMKITINNVPDQMPQKDGFVRIKAYNAVIQVVPITATKVQVEYTLHVDPGGSIPAWVINLVSKKMPITTFTNLKNRLKSQVEHKAMVSFISDK